MDPENDGLEEEFPINYYMGICGVHVSFPGCIAWVVPPSQDSSDHQDDITFSVQDSYKPKHLPLESWEGGQPKI